MDNGGDGVILAPGLWQLVTGCLLLASDLSFLVRIRSLMGVIRNEID